MATKSAFVESLDPNVILSGDIIGMQVDTLGLMCIPASREPIPEKEEQVSHLRIDTSHKKSSNADYRRCMFKVENDSGERTNIVFGSTIKISHYPTGLVVIGSSVNDEGYKESKMRCVFLSSVESLPTDSLVHKWIVGPRYKLREEGDPVRHNDYVVLRNAQYKQLYLTSFPVRKHDDAEHFTFCDHLLGLGPASVVTAKPGINIMLMRKGTGLQPDEVSGTIPTIDSAESFEDLVISSDYIRVMHREYRGHLIARTDDETELQSSVMPLGSTTRKRGKQALDNTMGVFLRAFADQQPREQLDFPAAYCSQGVWQVLSNESSQETTSMHSAVKFGTSIRLRHLITGQYLSVRPLEDNDTQKLKEYSSFCIPKQTKHTDLSTKSMTPTNRDRSRAIASANSGRPRGEMLPAALAESLRKEKQMSISGKKNSVQINGQSVEIQDPALLSIKTVDLCVVAILADGLHSSDWTGKHRNSVQMNFSADKGIWEFRTGRSDLPGNLCGWEVDKLNPSAHFKVSEDELKTDFLQVTVYREHMVSGRTAIGTGMSQISSLVSEFEPGETFDVVVALTDPASDGPGGTVTVRLCANTLLSKSEYNQLLINTAQAGLSPDRIAAFSSPSEFLDDESTATEESEEQGTQDQMIGDMLDGTLLMSHADISATNWVVGTSSAPDKYTKFNILVVDRKIGDDDFVSYNERFVLEHSHTRQRLKLSTLLGMDSQTTWWEYKSDVPLVPSPFRDGAIIDSEVCQFDRVDLAEIKDILFAARFMQLARAATTALQLTPRPSQLYMPLFRHFHNSLLTLTLWTLGIINSDSTLCAETTTHEDVKKQRRGAGFMKKLAQKLGNASEKLLSVVASPERLLQAGSDRVHQGMALLGLDQHSHSPHPDAAEDVDSDDESYVDDSDEGDGEDIDTDSEDQDDDYMDDGDGNDSDADGGWSQAIGLQMGMLSTPKSNSKYSALETAGRKNKKHRKAKRKSDGAPTTTTAGTATAETTVAPRHSSLAPWVGRKVPRPVTSNIPASKSGRTPGRAARTPMPALEIEETPLLKYANEKLDDFVYKDLPINEVLLRRQSILSDSALLDQIVHFLNVLFQLQRAVKLTHDPRMKEQYSCLPQFLLACSAQINKLISACVFKNEKVALKLISVQGSFLAMISQKIQGWDPPIEAILHQTCRNVTKQIPYGSIGSLNSQNDSLLGSTMHKDVGDDPMEQENDEERETLTPLDSKEEAFNIEPILMDAISASDVRQVVEQMHDLHLKRDPSALKILGMLTLLCSSGMAKKYFQNLLVNAIAIQDHEDFSLSGDFVQSQRASSLQTNCVLFFTQFANKHWEVKFNNPFSFPSQQSKNQEHQRAKLAREGSSLNKLFAHYNTDDNSVLDISECFELLEDLGLGGPFLYKEIRYLESATIWGFASWWCYRSSFYYPASSISQCQLSPVQAIQVMGEKMTPALMELEMRRTMVSEQAVARELDPLELLNERIIGLCLSYEEGFERDKGGLSIVEDYVRSLGGPDTSSSALDYFNSAGDDLLFESGKSTGGSAHLTKNRFSDTFLSARNNQPNSRHSPSTHFKLDPIDTSGVSHDWVEFGAALEDAFEDAAWFRMSLTLLAEICKDRNAYTQRIVGSILPAECLMSVLEADFVHYEEKAVLCKLLSYIYVDHRLVFPTRFSPFNTDIVYLGYREDILNPPITMGKLFNAQSRTRFLGPGSEDGSALRQRLFRHLAHKIKDVQLVSRSRAIISYYSAMLGLFKLLVLKGFFQEPEFGFVTSNQTPDDFADEGSSHNFYTHKASTQVVFIDDKAFTLEAVEKLLVQKLNFVLMAQRCTKDFEEICLLDDVLANEQHDALRGKHTPKASFTTKTARRFMRRKKNIRYDGEIEVNPEIAAKHIRARRNFDTLREKFAYFDVLYADDTMTSVVHSVVEILGYLHDIKQMLRLSRCWNYVVNAKTAMTERAYFQDMTDLETYVPRLQLGGFLEKLYNRFEPTEAVPKYIEAVFSATLYGDNDLRRKSFELLDRQLSLVRDGQHLFDQMHLVSKGHKAFLYRLATVYEEQLLVHVHAVVAQPDPSNAYVLERLTFAIENLRALHFSTFLDRIDAVRSDEDRRSYIRRTSTTVKREAKKLNIDAKHFLPDGKPEQDCMTYLMRPIPCPTGPEDFFELEMERLVMEEGATEALAEHFDLARQTATLSMPEAMIDCEVTMARLGSELIDIMLQLTRAPLFFPWHALFVSEKFLLDQLLSFLAEIGYNSAPLMNEWFPQLSEMLITYFPESIGCGKMAISILRRCRSAHTGKDTFSRQILRAIVHHGLVGTALCSSLLVAILQCDDAAAATFAAGFMLSRIQEFTSTFNFRTDPSEMLENDVLRTELHNILQPLSLCFNKRVTLPESVSSVLKVPLSPEFCKAYLNSESVPLYLKACIAQIAVWLYPFQVVSIEVYLLAELRSMRRAFNLDIGLDVEKSMAFSRDFVGQGLLPVLKKRILDSNLFTKLAINTAVVKIIDDVESTDIRNISIGKIVSEKFRANFPTKVTTSISKTKGSAGTTTATTGNARSTPPVLEEDEDNEGDLSKSFLDLSVFQCVMVLLNVLRLKYGAMSNILSPAQKADLIFVCTAALMVLSQYPERVVDPLIGEGLRSADFGAMMERLNHIVYGMVTEYLARGVEKHISTFYEARLIDAAKSQFRTTALAAPEKLVRSKAPFFDLQQCFVNESEADEKSRFSSAMNLAVVFPVEYLLHTPMYKFLATCIEKAASFIDLGGDMLFGDWRSPAVKSKSFAVRFTQYTDFDLFLRGDGRYIECMFQYLGRVRQPTDAEYNLLHLLSALLLHRIENIRHSQFLSLNIRLMLVDKETKRLRRLQMTLNNLGAQSFLNIALGNIYNAHTGEPYMWLYAPLVLSFTNEIISWGNRESQNSIMDTISFNISKNKPPEMNALLGLRTLIRRCYLEIAYCTAEASSSESNRMKAGFPDSEHTKILRLVKQLFTFVGTFCKGDNVHAQRFFSAQLGSSKQYVDLVLELCLLTNSILTKFTSMMVYIKSDVFYERLAPLVWETKDGTKRRFLAWHDPSNNIMLFSQYMYTITHMLDGLLSMCCESTASSVQQALNKCPDILEFGGLLQLDATSRVQGRSITGVNAGKQVVHWHGGKPFQFYSTYVSLLFASEVGEPGSENDLMVATLKKWTRGGRSRSFLGHHFGSSFNFLKIFGISFSHFEELARQMEEKCLSTMLGYFEVAPVASCTEMSSKFNDGMLMQNMNSTFQKIFSGGTAENDKYASTAVAYVSVLESMGHFFPETQLLLADWAESSLRQGNDPKKVFGVVEIVGKSGRLQRLYFPVPTFVSRFWPYPEVQKMKELIVMTVNRQSPEEKLVDFLQQMVRITTVMKRQERLRSLLTFPLHAFFGGKTTTFSSYLPNQRMLALLLTLALNIYYCYFTSLSVRFEPHSGSALNHWSNWSGMERTMIIVKAVHLGLNGSQTLSRILNSEVTDELFQTYKQDALVPDLLVKLALLPVAICYLIQDTFWPLCMLTFSFFALYANKFWLYVPCLFDVAFQFTFMNFLYVAVALNAGKIWYTLVLAFLCLYFYSVIATLYFTEQYSLDDHSGCENIVACFKLHLDYGLYNVPNWDNHGYISPVLPLPFVYGTLLARAIGTMYNVSYVILINLVLQSIISGLIIDTFSKLREENEDVLQDIYDKCFICSINRDEFEQAGIPFRQHILEQHNMWHYVWFKIYLESKDPLTYSSSENHSAEKMNVAQDFLRLIPIKKSLSLIQKKGEEEPDAQLEEKLDILLASMSKIQTANTRLGKSIVMLRRANARIEVKVNEKSVDKGDT